MILVILGLIYQGITYWWISGGAEGNGNLIQLLLVFILLLLAATTFFSSMLLCILWQQRHLKNGVKLTIIGFSSLLVYFSLSTVLS
ncbi:MAG: hypothetical protein HWE27_04250 [Gammaproteobacteria bacterium]|nr:hypothetical protein [Gammaproteobacteria bacterium]